MQPLIPHLRRALEIRDRLQTSQLRAETLATSLGNSGFGVVVLDTEGRVLEVNPIAEKLMSNGSGIYRNLDGKLGLREPAGSQLYHWILTGVPTASTDTLLHVPRASGQPLSVVVAPLPEFGISWMSGDPRWMLFLFDPDARLQASVDLIVADLGVSKREADVAALLAAGYGLNQIAVRLQITVNTVRTHLKSTFAKTGIRSQAELMRRIIIGPATLARRL